jgi:acyl carrier protein phosphodiesterase
LNYLAHLYLADDTPESLLGNLLGDFLKGARVEDFPAEVQVGIRRHFQVDAFTDVHPIPLESRRRIAPPQRRYGGVLVDIFYDHFLTRHWREFSPEPLEAFTARAYAAFASQEALLPERLRHALPRMREEDWLGSHREVDGVRNTLRRLSRRLRREHDLAAGADELVRSYAELEADFRLFFPDLVRSVRGEPPASASREAVVDCGGRTGS